MPTEQQPRKPTLKAPDLLHRPAPARTLPVEAAVSRFSGSGDVSEFHYMLRPVRYAPLVDQLDWIEAALDSALFDAGLSRGNIAFRRLFCSDLPNQACELAARGYSGTDSAISLVDQPPQPPAKVSLWVYCISDPQRDLERRRSGNSFLVERGELAHVWTTGLAAPAEASSHCQTLALFEGYIGELQRHGMRMAENLVRTWLFVKDIDSDYAGMVSARNEVFARHGLTSDTHFVASTGIEGSHGDVRAKVMMDAYAIRGIHSGQVCHLQALSHLNPTHEYGVAFERATAVSYRDRVHIFISGTASIDHKGRILHEGNVLNQLDRVLDNMSALLGQASATLEDMQLYIAYVRDPADAGIVRTILKERAGDKPFEVLIAPVCRPGWLVELEGVACVRADNPQLPGF